MSDNKNLMIAIDFETGKENRVNTLFEEFTPVL
jgi:hypothetical protein